jgi:hypothetical protein
MGRNIGSKTVSAKGGGTKKATLPASPKSAPTCLLEVDDDVVVAVKGKQSDTALC